MTDQENWKDASDAPVNADEWGQEVEAEAKIIIEDIGDGFMGRYTGMDTAGDSGIKQIHITNAAFLTGEAFAAAAFINATRDLEQKFSKIPVKSMVRVEWVSSLDTGHVSGTPMRIFKVQWK